MTKATTLRVVPVTNQLRWQLTRNRRRLGLGFNHFPAAGFTLGFPEVAQLGIAQSDPDEGSERLSDHDCHRTASMLANQARNGRSNPLEGRSDRLALRRADRLRMVLKLAENLGLT